MKNKLLKYKHLIIYLSLLLILPLAKQESYSLEYVSYVIGKIDTNITHRTYGALAKIEYDQDSTVWLIADYDLCRMRKGEKEFRCILDAKSKFFGPMNGFSRLFFDSLGNLIFPTKKNFIVIDTKTDDAKMYPLNFTPEIKSMSNIVNVNGGTIVGNRIYLYMPVRYNYIAYIEYDEKGKKWISDTSFYIRLPDTINTSLGGSYIIGDSLYLRIPKDANGRKLILNTKTNEYSIGEKTIFDSLKNIEGYQKNLGLVENTKKNIFTYACVINKRAYIIRLDKNTDSLTFYKMPYVLHPAVEKAPDNEVQYLFSILGFRLTAVDDNMDSFVFDYANHVYYWSEQEGFKYIPPPKHEDFDSTDWWNRSILFKYSDKEWWISGAMRYIYRIDVEKMLASRNEDFPYKNYNSVEEQETEARFKTIGILDISPIPCKSFFEFNYFLLPGFDRLDIQLFDVNGKRYDYKDYEILSEENIFRKVRLNLNGDMPSGVYILQITENGNTYSKKFVVK